MNQVRAVASLQRIGSAERHYASTHRDKGFACNLNDLTETDPNKVAGQDYIDGILASGQKAGYKFELLCNKNDSTSHLELEDFLRD